MLNSSSLGGIFFVLNQFPLYYICRVVDGDNAWDLGARGAACGGGAVELAGT